MSDKDYQIEYSNINERSQTPYLMDYVPDQLIKVYPYRASKGNKNKPFIQVLTASIIRLSQDVEDYKNLEQDENGIKFINMFAAWDDQTKVTVTSGAETFQQDIRKLRTYTALFNNFFTTDDDKPDFFTIGEPFNNVKYKAGTQRVYYGSNFQPSASELIVELIDQGYNIDEETRLAEITMQDVAALEEQYNKSVLLFTLDGNLLLNPTVTYNSKREGKVVTKPGIRLKANSYSLINSIKAKGELDFGNFKAPFSDIDFYTEHLFAPIKMSPDKVTDKITMFADWFDYSLTMPYFLAQQFNRDNGASIQDITLPNSAINDMRLAEFSNASIGENPKQIPISVNVTKNNNEFLSQITFAFSIIAQFSNGTGDIGSQDLEFTTQTYPEYNATNNTYTWSDRFNVVAYMEIGDLLNPTPVAVTGTITNIQAKISGNDVTISAFMQLTDRDNPTGSHHFKYALMGSKIIVRHQWRVLKPILENEDIMLLEDMILISSGFKDSWKKAPRNANKPEQIDPEYRVGHKGIRIQNISDKKPADVIDGLILEHEDTYPSFRTTTERYLIFRSVVNALSKYIVSNTYTTNQGFNELNAITLPWFLMLAPSDKDSNKIDYWSNAHNVAAQELGGTVTKKSYLLNGVAYDDKNVLTNFSTIKWATYSSYFTKTFSQLNDYTFKKGINLTDKLNLSGTKIIETDRKVILPELKDTIAENNKINVPGQNTGTEDYLSNYFYLPLNSVNDVEKVFFNGLTTKSVLEPGAKIIVNIPKGLDGIKWTTDMVKEYIYRIYPNTLIEDIKDTDISINKVLSFTDTLTGDYRWTDWQHEGLESWIRSEKFNQNVWLFLFTLRNVDEWASEANILRCYNRQFGQDMYDKDFIELKSNSLHETTSNGLTHFAGQATLNVYHNEFEPVTVTVRPGVTTTVPLSTPQLVSRQTYFDKTEWMKFTDAYLMPLGQKLDLYLVSEGDTKINWLEELTVMSVWGDEISLSCDGMTEELTFTLPSVSDETIAVQRIVII